MRFRASKRSSPRSSAGTRPAASTISPMTPSGEMTTGIASPCRLPTSKSLGSWAGVTLTAPVPNSRSTYASAIDREGDARDGQCQRPPDEGRVALVLGVHRHGDVAEHRLGTRRRDRESPRRVVGERIADVPELPFGLVELRLLVRERGEAARAPVDDVVAAVDQSALVEA